LTDQRNLRLRINSNEQEIVISVCRDTPSLTVRFISSPCDHPVANAGFQYRGATAVDVICVTPQRILHPAIRNAHVRGLAKHQSNLWKGTAPDRPYAAINLDTCTGCHVERLAGLKRG
jgi:hypothetical protein